MVAANMANKVVVIDVEKGKLEAIFESGIKPHPGRGANWVDPKFGPVNGTPHLGEGKVTVYGTDVDGTVRVVTDGHAYEVETD